MEKKDIKKLLENNPKIDPDKLAQVRESLKLLRGKGIKGAGFNVVLPFSRSKSSLRRAQ